MPIISGGGGGGGGSAPTTRATYAVAAAAVSSGTDTKLTFTKSYGADPLDLTDPQNPTPSVSGIYAVTAWVSANAGTSGKAIRYTLIIDNNDFSAAATQGAPMTEESIGVVGEASVALTFYCPAGSPLFLNVTHNDAGTTPAFAGVVQVQRVT